MIMPDYRNEDVVSLARQLLGCRLCTRVEGQLTSGIIVETEAYRAPEDKASHAFGNRRTKRTDVIFQQGGISYVYLCYGLHHLFNVVSGPEGMAHAILVRALQPDKGMEIIQTRRGQNISRKNLTNGPGKLCQALAITRDLNGQELNKTSKSTIWIESGRNFSDDLIVTSKRVGVDYAEEWKDMPWRFYIKDNPWVSVN